MLSQRLASRVALGVLGLALLVPAGVLGLLWYAYYFVHRDCIEEAWRAGANGCFVMEESLTYSGGAAVLVWPALMLCGAAALCFWHALKRRRGS